MPLPKPVQILMKGRKGSLWAPPTERLSNAGVMELLGPDAYTVFINSEARDLIT